SFALYGFPESHAASFALLAYASAYLKCHYLAAFTAAMLNNQPMGFYSPATLVKDAQRHGLRVRAIDVTRSDWLCTLEKKGDESLESRDNENEQTECSQNKHSPLMPMTPEARLVADFRNTGMTVGPHPMSYHRPNLRQQGILSASDLHHIPDGTSVRVAGAVIARQRPGTAKGFVFLSLEDETGIANAIITPQLFHQDHLIVVHQQFLLIEGRLQNQDNVISVKAERVLPLSITQAETTSHD